MAENLQGLLDRIHRDGLAKAESERDDILDRARKEAARIVSEAEAEAASIRSGAEADADREIKRAESSIRQAARDVVLSLREELDGRMRRLVRNSAAEALTPEVVAEVLRALAGAVRDDPSKAACERLELMVAPDQLEKLGRAVAAAVKDDFQSEPQVFADRNIKGGVKVSINGADAFFDCTDAGFTELLAGYLSPRLAELIAGGGE